MCMCFLCRTLQVLMDRYVRNSGLFFFFFFNLEETISTYVAHIYVSEVIWKNGQCRFPPLSGLSLGKIPLSV